MSKVLRQFHKAIMEAEGWKKFFMKHNAGDRIFPSKAKDSELRYDAGEEVTEGVQNIYLQINSEAKNTALKRYRSKHGTHANVAALKLKLDVPEDKQEEEMKNMITDAEAQFSEKIG